MSRLQKFGESKSCADGYGAALEIFDFHQERVVKGPKFADLTWEHVSDDNVNALLVTFAQWLVVFPIPRYRNADFEPARDDTTYLVASTLLEYFGKVKEAIKDKFPQHEDLKGEPLWYSDMLNALKVELNRQSLRRTEDFGDRLIRPLLKTNRRTISPGTRDSVMNHWLCQTDLETVCMNLLKSAKISGVHSNLLERRYQLTRLRTAVSRGGEPKFQQYSKWTWIPGIDILDTSWQEMKTIKEYAMAEVADRDHYAVDTYHAWGCYAACENGLFRSEIQRQVEQFVFPDLHRLKDESVARLLTKTIRDFLPMDVPADQRRSYSVKSIQKGCILELSLHKDIGIYESHGRSGHSIGTSQESYFDRSCVASSLPGGRALAGWKHTELDSFPPRLECLGAHVADELEKFMGKLYVISLPDFLPQGHLRPVLRTATASLLMYHRMMIADCGNHNVVVDKLHRTAMDISLSDPQFPDAHGPADVLLRWSERIEEDFRNRNVEIAPATHDMVGLTTTVHQQTELLAGVQEAQRNQAEETKSLKGIVMAQQSELVDLKGQLSEAHSILLSVSNELTKVSRKLNPFKTPPSSPDVKRPAEAPSAEPTAKRAAVAETAPVETAPVETEQPAETTREEAAAARANQPEVPESAASLPLRYGAEAEFISASSESNKDVKVKMMIRDLYNAKRLFTDGTLDFAALDKLQYIKENSRFKACMELVELVATDEQRADLKKKDLAPERLLEIAGVIEAACMAKMYELDNSGNPNDSKSQATATYLALGSRVVIYKNKKKMKGRLQEITDSTQTTIGRFFHLGGN